MSKYVCEDSFITSDKIMVKRFCKDLERFTGSKLAMKKTIAKELELDRYPFDCNGSEKVNGRNVKPFTTQNIHQVKSH